MKCFLFMSFFIFAQSHHVYSSQDFKKEHDFFEKKRNEVSAIGQQLQGFLGAYPDSNKEKQDIS